MLQILPIPALKDNYIWMVVSRNTNRCIIVDPGESTQIIDMLKLHHLKLDAIFITHHHYDHTDGIQSLVHHFNPPVYGPAQENIAGITHPLAGGETISIKSLDLTFNVIAIPGHTLGHIAYHNNEEGFIFTGDTLFTGACGRVFEGTPTQMYTSLSKLAALPDHTLIYCGHEYTENSLKFSIYIEPLNQYIISRIEEIKLLRKYGLPTVPAPLFLEKQTNPFLRCHEKAVIHAAESYEGRKLSSSAEVFASIRRQKDQFKP